MLYAEFCPYGIRTISDGDTFMAFDTREERDEMVDRINDAHSEMIDGCAVAVTTREVAHRYNFNDFKIHRSHNSRSACRIIWGV